MDEEVHNLEILATRSLAQRGLARAPDALAFIHNGHRVEVTIDKSVYRGYFITVHAAQRPELQFRAVAGGYDWNAIAACIVEIAEGRSNPPIPSQKDSAKLKDENRQLADELSTLTGTGPNSLLSIEPSPSAPGKVRVRLDEIDLDPASVMELNATISRALTQKPNGRR
jgi:hypothetical protein